MISTVEIHPQFDAEAALRRREAPWSRPITPAQLAALVSDTGPASPRRRAELKSAPGFPGAVRRTAAKLAELHRGNPLLNRIINDRGRFFVAQFVLDLHFRGHDEGIGLTPGRLKALCAEQGICSGTRAGALLALMQLGGYVEPAPRGKDRRRRELVPTEKLIAEQRARWRCIFSGAAPMLPDAASAQQMLERPDFGQGLVRLVSAHYRAGYRFTNHAPGLRLFCDRSGGMFVLLALLSKAEPGVEEALSPIPISISGLARAISSSRAHVVKLLKDAESEGLVQRSDPGTIVLLPPLVHDLHEFFALNYLLVTHAARVTRR